MFLLDTSVLSDGLKLNQFPDLQTWLAKQPASSLFISSISLAELAFGVSRLPDGKRKQDLVQDLNRISQRFSQNILPINVSIAMRYGSHHANQIAQGFNDHPFDSFIIATAIDHDLTVVTRNLKHYQNRGVRVLNPY